MFPLEIKAFDILYSFCRHKNFYQKQEMITPPIVDNIKKYGIKLTILSIILQSFGCGVAQLTLEKKCRVDPVLSGFMMTFGLLLVFVVFLFFRERNDHMLASTTSIVEDEVEDQSYKRSHGKPANWKINLLYFIIFCNMATTIASAMMNMFNEENCWANKLISFIGFSLLGWITFLIVWFGMDVHFV
jgi:hypothetical protein